MWGRAPGVRVGLAKEPTPLPQELAVAHRARLDVPAPILKAVTGWISRHRRRPGARPWQRAATVHAQVLLVLRWLRHRADVHALARDTGVSDATGYRYLHEALDVIAAHAPRPARGARGCPPGRNGAPVAGWHADPHRPGRRPRRGRAPPVVLRQAPRGLRRQRAGARRPDRLSAVDLRGAARLDPRSDRRPGAGAARAVSARH